MPDRRSLYRLLALSGFLLVVALALWLAELRPLLVAVVMVLALAIVWSLEWLAWRQAPPEPADSLWETPSLAEGPTPPPFPTDALYDELTPLVSPEPVPEAEPEPEAPLVEPEPEPELVHAAVSEPSPPPPPEPPRPPLRPVPPPPPAPPPPPGRPPAAARPSGGGVVDLRRRATLQPRSWNLWDLERLAHDEAQRDPFRHEEWSYLFVHLRQFAAPDGSLPTEFDALVRESFAELLEQPRA